MDLTCPTCGPGDTLRPYGIRSGYPLVSCQSCGLVFLESFDANVDTAFYHDVAEEGGGDTIEYWSFPDKYEKYRSVFDGFFAERWQYLQQANPNIRRVLDIGCGYGFFLKYAAAHCSEAIGLELDPNVADFARREYGLDIRGEPVESFSDDHLFDAIIMADVLEHLKDPKAVLEKCRALLAPDGVIFVQVPNVLGFKLPYGHSWGLPHHIWQFSTPSLTLMLERAGFSVRHHHTGVMGVVGVYERGGPSLADRVSWWTARKLGIGNRLAMIAARSG